MCVQPPEEKSLKIGEFGNHEVRAKHACVLSYVRLFVTLRTAAHKAPLSRQENWSGLPFPTPGDLLNPRIESASLASPALPGGFFTTEPSGKPRARHTPVY